MVYATFNPTIIILDNYITHFGIFLHTGSNITPINIKQQLKSFYTYKPISPCYIKGSNITPIKQQLKSFYTYKPISLSYTKGSNITPIKQQPKSF